ncbi:MAG: Na/Pi cotransporter family protein [Termitinemataceae bacterium]|nr:MAG: Na/Pi cotransporter family protein [Termitinemataceae bacterium]
MYNNPMSVLNIILSIGGSLGLFLFGMKVMSDGIQQGAGDRLQRVLGFMTGNTFSAIFTGLSVTAIIQSSSATTVMVISFVSAGIMTLTQAIGVIMGANIGTTVTAWIVSLVGFQFEISALSMPFIGIGFLMRILKWKYQEIGNAVLGFGILFLGLDFLTKSMPAFDAGAFEFLKNFSSGGLIYVLIFEVVGLIITVLLHSSSASTAIMLTMALNNIIDFRSACAMILGANIGTCIDALLASFGAKTDAKRAALVHILFNFLGAVLATIFLKQLLAIVSFISPSDVITTRLAMFHTAFNVLNTVIFFPFVKQLSYFVCWIIKMQPDDTDTKKVYKLDYKTSSMRDTPELSVYRAKNEIQDLAGLVYYMYNSLHMALKSLNEETVSKLTSDLREKEDYADQMREQLTFFLMECTRKGINQKTEHNVALLMRIVADLEDLTDDCFSIGMLLERSVRKNQMFKTKELDALDPYMKLVQSFLVFVREHMGQKLTLDETSFAGNLEEEIDASRNALRKLGRKRIEEGENVKTELLFIDLVRRIERLGDYCYSISSSMSHME